jgi:hypothetical protein
MLPHRGEGAMKVLLVGGSHIAALQNAAKAGAGLPGVDAVFRALGGREFYAIDADEKAIRVRPQALLRSDTHRPNWGAIDETVSYDTFDHFVVVSSARTLPLLQTFAMRKGHRYSTAYFHASVNAFVRADHGLRLATRIAQHSGRGVSMTVSPLPAKPFDTPVDWEKPWRRMINRLHKVAKKRGVTFVPQPEETLECFAWTKPEYAVGSIRLSGREHPLEEHVHMNAAFGAIALPHILRAATERKADAA